MEALKKYKWTLSILFVFNFTACYVSGYYSRPIFGHHWDFFEEYSGLPPSSDLEKLGELFSMLIHFRFMLFFESLWVLSPILFSTMFAFGTINLYFLMEIGKRSGKKHIAEKIIQVLITVSLIYMFYLYVM